MDNRQGIKRIPQNFAGLTDYLKGSPNKVYIFGADIAGKVTNLLLKEDGINVAGFLDNNKNKCGTDVSGIPVLHAPELEQIDKNSSFLIASTYIADIIDQLESQGFYNWAPISSIIENNPNTDFEALISGDLQTNHAGGVFTKDFVTFAVTNMVNSQKKYLDPDKLFIRSVDLVLTEKCSLKCKDCANLMQYYENPINIAKAELLQDLEDLCSLADEINEIRIIGGEPLMNKDFHTITAAAAEYPNVNKVVVYTNGTICPPREKLEILKNEKVFIFITTYGDLSRNQSKLSVLLEENGIRYNNQPAYGWTECGGIQVHDRTTEMNTEIFRNCCAKHFTTITDGKLFRCPFSANAERLMAIPEAPSDYFDVRLSRANGDDTIKAKKKLKWFLREKSLIEACDSCNGRTYGDPEITPGIQAKKPIEYQLYERA